MAEEKQGQAAAPVAPKADMNALAAFAQAAQGFQAMQAQAAQEALRLPHPRLDHVAPQFFLTPDGSKVKPDGTPFED